MATKTIFLDRDGVINHDMHYLFKINEFKFFDGIFEACQYFEELGYKIIIVTNQSGIARGYYNESDYLKITRWMVRQFKNNDVNILDIFHCPHGPNSKCICRKPKPGMLNQAIRKYNVDLRNSWMIGDKETDMQAAMAAGIENNKILLKSSSKIDSEDSIANHYIDSIKNIKEIIKH